MIVTADDMRDVHERVIDDNGKIIRRIAVAAFDDQIIQLIIIKADIAFNEIFYNGDAGLCAAETHNTSC